MTSSDDDYDFTLYHDKEDLSGTTYLEIAPDGWQHHWEAGMSFVSDDALIKADGFDLIRRYYPDFDPRADNCISALCASTIADAMSDHATRLHHPGKAKLLQDIAHVLSRLSRDGNPVWILGLLFVTQTLTMRQ